MQCPNCGHNQFDTSAITVQTDKGVNYISYVLCQRCDFSTNDPEKECKDYDNQTSH